MSMGFGLMQASLVEIVRAGELPESADAIIPLISNPDGTYLFQEGNTWDFKQAWPFSYSDPYFAGLCRLACAFANSEGGVIIFGVDDETRKGGKTKIQPNMDRFEQAFRQLTGRLPKFQLRRYQNEALGDVDILLVPRKSSSEPPLRFLESVHGYEAGTIWVRRSSEVCRADSSDIPILYLRSDIEDASALPPEGQLPPSPATVREFVGRMETIDRVFTWLMCDDEPRAFLYGKGGSGKSTIAYEVYKNIKLEGSGLRIARNLLQRMIFISAKRVFLNVERQKPERFVGYDFTNESELYTAILALGGADIDDGDAENLEVLKRKIKAFFDENCCFVVIDDIDTLTTAGVEAGIDFLHGVLWRAKTPSKLLYTLRNRPTHSISSAIEVAGLSGAAYEEFVRVCSKQFSVAPPDPVFRDGTLLAVSEGRPLVVESIIALRRHTGSYDAALALFEKGSGEDVRSYVFEREWNALDTADRGREILALLALYNRPIAFSDLVTISRLEASKVKDAIASTQEMFLTMGDNGVETTYELGDLTKAFVSHRSKSLDLYETIKARVEKFKSTFYPDNPVISRLTTKLDRALYDLRLGDRDRLEALKYEIDGGSYEPKVAEDPRFLALRGYVNLLADPVSVSKARMDFRTALEFNYAINEEMLRVWFRAEVLGDTGDERTLEILELIDRCKGYDQAVRTDFKFERACYLYSLGRSSASLEPVRSIERLTEALRLHLEAYEEYLRVNAIKLRKSEEFTRNTAFFLTQRLLAHGTGEEFLKLVKELARDPKLVLDPLVEPLVYCVRELERQLSRKRGDLQRILSRFDTLTKELSKASNWCVKEARDELLRQGDLLKAQYKRSIERLLR